MSGYLKLDASQITSELWERFPASIFTETVTNQKFNAVTREWVEKKFSPWWWEYLHARDLYKYAARGNQCEHFAMRALLEAVTLFKESLDPAIDPDVESLAAAWACYVRDDGRGHAVVLWRVETGWEPWEPQIPQFMAFSESERLTVKKPFVL